MQKIFSDMQELIRYGAIPPKTGLAREAFFLRRQIRRTEELIDRKQQEFVEAGGCPCCFWAAAGGYSGRLWFLSDKNERREARLKYIEAKLKASTADNKDKENEFS